MYLYISHIAAIPHRARGIILLNKVRAGCSALIDDNIVDTACEVVAQAWLGNDLEELGGRAEHDAGGSAYREYLFGIWTGTDGGHDILGHKLPNLAYKKQHRHGNARLRHSTA